jgi:hypothetical protein
MNHQLAAQIYIAMERLGADDELLSIIGSYGDTLDNTEVLARLEHYNKTGRALTDAPGKH